MKQNKLIRYIISLMMVLLMVGISEYMGEKEIIFPEMVALSIGLWIIDKRVWKVQRRQIVLLMTLGAIAGICIVRYSPLPHLANLCLSFTAAATCLLISRTTLIPLISACMLPVLLYTETWIYPIAVFTMSVIVTTVQKIMEYYGLRHQVEYISSERVWKKDIFRWLSLLLFVLIIATLSNFTGYHYMILPPLIVTFVEMVNSKAGFRNRPTQIFLFLFSAASLGTFLQIAGHYYLHLPESIVAVCIAACLFFIFEWTGKYFAPAGALAFIPLILPQENLKWLPLQVVAGSIFFITIAMIAYQKCYKWSHAQIIYCATPTILRKYITYKKQKRG